MALYQRHISRGFHHTDIQSLEAYGALHSCCSKLVILQRCTPAYASADALEKSCQCVSLLPTAAVLYEQHDHTCVLCNSFLEHAYAYTYTCYTVTVTVKCMNIVSCVNTKGRLSRAEAYACMQRVLRQI